MEISFILINDQIKPILIAIHDLLNEIFKQIFLYNLVLSQALEWLTRACINH
jgi:hypothetical protein